MTQVEGSSIEEEAKQVVHEAINHAIEANREKGEQLSSEMGRDAQTLENNRQETTESISDATAQKTKLEQNQKLLERFGLGHTLDSGLSKLESNITELEDTNDEIIQTMQELSQITQKASNIWRETEKNIHIEIPDKIVDTWSIEDLLNERDIRSEAWNTLLEAFLTINDSQFSEYENNKLDLCDSAANGITATSNTILLSAALIIEMIKNYKK